MLRHSSRELRTEHRVGVAEGDVTIVTSSSTVTPASPLQSPRQVAGAAVRNTGVGGRVSVGSGVGPQSGDPAHVARQQAGKNSVGVAVAPLLASRTQRGIWSAEPTDIVRDSPRAAPAGLKLRAETFRFSAPASLTVPAPVRRSGRWNRWPGPGRH